ncbi:site-specific recombinase XerD [Herbihabitans rhizosphaerae]|uniref:Site-specific recombinase XerD n=1 Tax=Herbihabitans rhizosphaerae TaxID=1872711 RepID=A0A4Q7L359_9PSEU|nr:site-specific integrase [Herbihabitans rhizosphaerae]RZS43576.1 site-specific recombinase XerD [Herbihabitans rhizosphaerae]
MAGSSEQKWEAPAVETSSALEVFDQFGLRRTEQAADLERQIAATVALLPVLPPPDPDDPYDPRTLTVRWLVDLADTSRRSYFLALADFLLWCRHVGRDPLLARRADTDAWKAQMTAQRWVDGELVRVKPAADTVCKRLSGLSSWYGYLQDNELAVLNPAARTKRPKRRKRSPYPTVDATELAMFLDGLVERAERLGEEAAWRDAAMFTLMFHTGLRIAPVLRARISDIGFESDGHQKYAVLHYVKKGGEADWVPLSEDVLRLLHRYWDVRARRAGIAVENLSGFVFVSTPHPRRPELTGGRQMVQSNVYDHFKVVARDIGVSTWETITLHSTRRTAGTIALANGASLQQVQDLLGHADPRTTRGYDAARHRLGTSPVHTIAQVISERRQHRV